MKRFTLHIFLAAIFCSSLLIQSCKEEELPHNPYSDVDYGNPPPAATPPDPNSIAGIHQNILMVKCNNPGCHDGTFEPDFRTVQSAWSTLVYHRIVKNTADTAFNYRVIPYNTSESMLIRRLTVDDPALQRMPATGDYLTSTEMNNITTWINNGARDIAGNVGTLPNSEPLMIGFIAYDSVFVRLDTHRVDDIYYNPILIGGNRNITFAFLLEDDSTAVSSLLVNKVKFSTNKDDFSSAIVRNATYFSLGGYTAWVVTVNTNIFATGSTVYFRYYVNDGDHAFDTEYPRTDMNEVYKTYFAIYIEP